MDRARRPPEWASGRRARSKATDLSTRFCFSSVSATELRCRSLLRTRREALCLARCAGCLGRGLRLREIVALLGETACVLVRIARVVDRVARGAPLLSGGHGLGRRGRGRRRRRSAGARSGEEREGRGNEEEVFHRADTSEDDCHVQRAKQLNAGRRPTSAGGWGASPKLNAGRKAPPLRVVDEDSEASRRSRATCSPLERRRDDGASTLPDHSVARVSTRMPTSALSTVTRPASGFVIGPSALGRFAKETSTSSPLAGA